jgi:CTP:molybdopterin cytidylyltransferase MocA
VVANVAGILLAAGQGSRLGRPKATIVLGGRSLAARGVALLADGGTAPVIVVTGAAQVSAGDISHGAAGAGQAGTGRGESDSTPGVLTVRNDSWRTGMGSSLAVGLAAVPSDCAAAVIALVDQPLVGAASVRRLIEAFGRGASVAVAAYQGKARNPVLISREHFAAVADLAAGSDVGARPFLRANPGLVTLVECGDTGRPDDIDSADDLDRIGRLIEASLPFPVKE